MGDLPSTVVAFKEAAPFLVMPVKAALAFPLVYHYVGELPHPHLTLSLSHNSCVKDRMLGGTAQRCCIRNCMFSLLMWEGMCAMWRGVWRQTSVNAPA